MIDDIVEMILKEARGYFYLGRILSVITVKRKVDMKLDAIINIYNEEERGKKENENKRKDSRGDRIEPTTRGLWRDTT